ncbi:sugar transferase, partial [Pseudonocardia sp.]|uniref:sugar transferase n=1 Tax=Pseudonocardia sp. TaxID=60912 RepID=UPI0039C8FC48
MRSLCIPGRVGGCRSEASGQPGTSRPTNGAPSRRVGPRDLAGHAPRTVRPNWEAAVRRGVELTLALLALLVLAVPMIVIGLVVRWSSVGPALFQQQRVGFGGRSFTMYKFRTMRTGVGDEM